MLRLFFILILFINACTLSDISRLSTGIDSAISNVPETSPTLGSRTLSSRTLGSRTLGSRTLGPQELVGLDIDSLSRRLGTPHYQRVEGLVTVWQYRLDACVVDFIILSQNNSMIVSTWQARHPENETYNHSLCSVELANL